MPQVTMREDEKADILVCDFKDVYFNGQKSKQVMPGEFFYCDPIELEYEENEYLCLEITFSGKMIPHHEQSLLPVFVKDGDVWKSSKQMPFAGMIGCDRKVKGKVAYLGDSITQGIGTKPNSYLHWNALLSQKLGSEYSYWNLGLGFGKASDAASDGAWLYKAKQNDVIFVCFGVNDILQGKSEEDIKSDLTCIVETLKKSGKKVILQTIPPFGYVGANVEKWNRVNAYILTELKNKVDYVFDTRKYLSVKEIPERAKYNDHPNEEGCQVWADALFNEITNKGII
jgi:lysophospholipase L1-like esterase